MGAYTGQFVRKVMILKKGSTITEVQNDHEITYIIRNETTVQFMKACSTDKLPLAHVYIYLMEGCMLACI